MIAPRTLHNIPQPHSLFCIDMGVGLWYKTGRMGGFPCHRGLWNDRFALGLGRWGLDTQNFLAGMGIGPGPGSGPGPGRPAGGNPPSRITGQSLGYDEIVNELLLSPPGETQRSLAKRLGYTESWLSRLVASDSFQTRLSKRLEAIEPEKREIFRLRFASIEEEARGILLESLKKLSNRLEDPAGVPDQLIVKSVEVTSRLLGYGARAEQPPPKVEMHVHLNELADNLRKLNGAPSAQVIEGECTTIATVPAGGGGQS